MKIENRSHGHKRSHKVDGIGVGRNRTFPFSSDSVYDSVAYDPVKTRLSESEAGEEQSNIAIGLKICFCLRLWQCSFHYIVSNGVVSGMGVLLLTPSIWFSLDCIALLFWLRLWLQLCRSLVKNGLRGNNCNQSVLKLCASIFTIRNWKAKEYEKPPFMINSMI